MNLKTAFNCYKKDDFQNDLPALQGSIKSWIL